MCAPNKPVDKKILDGYIPWLKAEGYLYNPDWPLSIVCDYRHVKIYMDTKDTEKLHKIALKDKNGGDIHYYYWYDCNEGQHKNTDRSLLVTGNVPSNPYNNGRTLRNGTTTINQPYEVIQKLTEVIKICCDSYLILT